MVASVDDVYVYCQYGTPVMFPGSGSVGVCGYVELYDSVTGYQAPTSNSQWHYIYDACGNQVDYGDSYGWHILGSNPPYLSTTWIGGDTFSVPASTSPNCLGNWTEVYYFQETFTNGVTLTASATNVFPVYQSYADYVAQNQPQQGPTGGAVDPREQAGGCGSGHSSHADATAYPIDTSSGNFWHTFGDLSIPGRGRAIDLTRTYNSIHAGVDGPFGFGWTDSYGGSLTIQPSTVVVNGCNGSQATFVLNGSTWSAPPRVLATLVHNGDGTWTFTRGTREIYVFDASGRLTAERDLNGFTTTIAYPTSTTRQVTDPAGRTLTFAFTGSHVTSVTDSSVPPRTLTYSYDGSGNLTDVIDVGGGHSQFTYDGSHRMLTMRSPRFYGDATTTPSPVVTNHYDAQGRVDWQSDPLGRVTSFDYTSIPSSTKVTDPKGNVTVYKYQDGLLVFETRGYGTTSYKQWAYRYDPDTLGVTRIVDPNGHSSFASYDSVGNVLTKTDGLSRQTTYTYNSLRLVTSVREPRQVNGQPILRTFTYDTAGNLVTQSAPLLDASGNVVDTATTRNHYDDASHPGDITSRTDANGNTSRYTYDSFGNLTSITAPPTPENGAGNKTTFGYDASKGRLTSTIAPRGNATGGNPADHTTTFAHDAYGRVTVTKDPLWNAAQPTKHQTIKQYDADGNLDSVTDGNNHTTQYTYNAAGEQTEIRRADNSVLKMEYWPDGALKTQIDGAGRATSYEYDPLRQLQKVTDPLGRATTYTIDAVGNVLRMQDPTGRITTTAHDAADQAKSITYSDGITPNVTNITYDANGQRTAMTDGTGTSTWTYDSLHRLSQHTDGAGQTVQYGYDIGGRLTSITYPGTTGTVVRTYDGADRLASVRDWSNRTTSFEYDSNSNLLAQRYPNGTTAAFVSDAANQVSSISHAPTPTPAVSFATFSYGRDGAGQPISVASTGVPTDNHTWSYNQINQLTGVDSSSYAYDAADNLNRRLDGTAQAHDVANQLNVASPAPISLVGTTSASGSSSTSLALTLPAGTAAGDQVLIAATLPYGKTINTPAGFTPVGTYSSGTANSSAKLAVYRRTVAVGDTSVTVSFQGKFDKTATLAVYRGVHPVLPVQATTAGLAAPGTSVTTPNLNATTFGQRLLWVGGASGTAGTWTAPTGMTARVQRTGSSTNGIIADQALSNIGDVGSRTATHSSSAQLVGVLVALRPAGVLYDYDKQGNQTAITTNSGSIISQTYDQANRLTAYGTTATYRYNGDGLRMSKTVSGVTSAFTWDASVGVPTLLAEGSTNYIYGIGGLPVARIDASGGVVYYHQDQLGSTRALTNAAGAVVNTYSYDPYGNVTGSTGTTTNPLRFAGQYTDDESGYQYLRARYYDPSTGHFLTRDPVTALTRQPYAYTGGNPLSFTDPTGLCPPCAAILIGAVGGATIDLGAQAVSNKVRGCGVFDNIRWGHVAGGAALGGATGGLGAWAKGAATGGAGLAQINEGIYIIRGTQGTYVGQSGNIAERFSQHLIQNGGRFTQAELNAAERVFVSGGKTAREIAEQQRIDQLGGVGVLLNVRNPIGPARLNLMPQPYLR